MMGNYSNNIIPRVDGSVEINGDASVYDNTNFTSKMISDVVADGMKLDMKYIKKKENENNYKVLFGNFPVVDHPNNRLTNEQLSEINQKANEYDPSIDYSSSLNDKSFELGLLMKIVDENVVGKEGAFQFAVNNSEGKHDIAVAMDENYNDLKEVFIDKEIEQLDSQRMVIRDTGEQFSVLSTIDDDLGKVRERNANPQRIMKLGKMEDDNLSEAANVNFTFLMVAAIAEVLLLGFYIFFIR